MGKKDRTSSGSARPEPKRGAGGPQSTGNSPATPAAADPAGTAHSAQSVEERLKELQAIYDGMFDGLLIADWNSKKFLRANSKMCQMLGYSQDELLDMSVPDIHPPEARTHILELLRSLAEGRQKLARDLPMLCKNGSVFYADGVARASHVTVDGRPCILAFFRDVTDRRLAEEGIRAERDLARKYIDVAGVIIMALGAAGEVTLINQRGCEVLGVVEAEIIGRNWFDTFLPEDEREEVRDVFARLMAGELEPLEYAENRIVTRGGQQRLIAWHNVLLTDRDGNTVGTLSSGADITERTLAEVEREKLIVELEAKNAELERFTYTVSHDLKSPLITIKGYCGLLREDIDKGTAQAIEDDLARIENAADKMERLLAELLELSRVGRLTNPSQQVSLVELAQEAVELVGGRIHERGVRMEISPDLPVVFGDRPRLLEVLQNLIDNAAKYMGDQPRPRVEIGVRQDGPDTVCYVADNGLGVDPRYHEKIFGLFETLDPRNAGSGIGLALAKRIIEIHGGRIWVESEGAGRGSTFCFTIPPERSQ